MCKKRWQAAVHIGHKAPQKWRMMGKMKWGDVILSRKMLKTNSLEDEKKLLLTGSLLSPDLTEEVQKAIFFLLFIIIIITIQVY